MAINTPTCQACGGSIDGPQTYPLIGISIARICVSCRQDYQRLIMVTYPELTASFDEITAEFRRAQSGHPTSTGVAGGTSVFERHITINAQFIEIWDEFLEAKKETDEQG